MKGQSGVWETAAGDHIARFDSKFIELSSGKGRVRFAPQGVTLPTPVVSVDGLTVTYPEVWPGVDLRYRLLTDAVKEEIVITDARALPAGGRFLFDVSGPGLKKDENGNVRIEGELGTDLLLSGVVVYSAEGLPVSNPTVVSTSLGDRRENGNDKIDSLAVGVDPVWAGALPKSAFPLVVDPGYYWAPFIQVAESQPGWSCGTNPNCPHASVGNSFLFGGDQMWRTAFGYDYTAFLPTSTVASVLTKAEIVMTYSSGTTLSQPIALRRASVYGWCGVYVSGCSGADNPPVAPMQWMGTNTLTYDVTSVINPYWYAGAGALGFIASSFEQPGVANYKELDTGLIITYDRLPIVTQTGVTPAANPHLVHYTVDGIDLSVPAQTDPDGEALYYRFVLCNTASWATCVIQDDSGWISSNAYSKFVGTGAPPAWYNQQFYWGVQLWNGTLLAVPGGGSVPNVLNSSWLRPWKLYNNVAASPSLLSPADGFRWAPNVPAALKFTTPADPDGDSVRYRVVVRGKGISGVSYTSDWSALILANAVSDLTIVLPTDAPLQPNALYEWTVEFQDHIFGFHFGEPQGIQPTARGAEFEARLGSGGPSPMQPLGPVAVNLATGNLTTTISTPAVSTLGGSIGASFTYNSRANDIGLRARVVNDSNGNMVADVGEQVTTQIDREIALKWASPGSAAPNVTNLWTTWSGFITPDCPGVATTCTLFLAGAVDTDDKVQVKIGATTALEINWAGATSAIPFGSPLGQTRAAFYNLPNVNAGIAGVAIAESMPVSIQIQYRNPTGSGHLALYATTDQAAPNSLFAELPGTWLSPDARVLPRGWTFNHSEGHGAVYSSARVDATEIILTLTDGSSVAYKRNGEAFVAPEGEDDVVTFTDGVVVVTDSEGYVHRFRTTGELETVTAPVDAASPAAPIPLWTSWTPPGATTPSSRLTRQTDPISGRFVEYIYQEVGAGVCPVPGGYIAPDPGMLCQVNFPDGSATKLYYSVAPTYERLLARVENPGNATLGYSAFDLEYQLILQPGGYTIPLIAKVRDALVNEAIVGAADEYKTTIVYDGKSRVIAVNGPRASTTATVRQQINIAYQDVGGVTVKETRLLVTGLDNAGDPNDWDRKVQFDDVARTTMDYGTLNGASTQFTLSETRWHPSIDRPEVSITNGQASTNIFNYRGEVVESFGPTNRSCLDLTTPSPYPSVSTVTTYKRPNGSCTSPPVPHTSNEFDTHLNADGTSTPLQGLATSWWNNATTTGPPAARTTGLGGAGTTMVYDWLAAAPGITGVTATDFSLRSNGEIWFNALGGWGFEIVGGTDDTAVVTVDGTVIAAKGQGVTTAAGVYTVVSDPNQISGTSHVRRIVVDFRDVSGNAALTLNWTPPGSAKVAVPLNMLRPRYSLATRSTVDDSNTATPTLVTHTSYDSAVDAALGMVVQTVQDPAGAKLATTTTYETGGFRRR